MPRFRATSVPVGTTGTDNESASLDGVRLLIGDALRPAHFFVGPSLALDWQPPAVEDAAWEILRGRLLDPAHTRQRQAFEAWNIYVIEGGVRSAEPLLSVKLNATGGQVHVVRGLHCYAWEGYDAGGGVYLSREVRKWVRELVGTIDLARFRTVAELRDELICRLFQAVVGTSRLPLTSVEAPLPAFSLGQLAYFYRPGLDKAEARSGPARSWRELLERVPLAFMAGIERAKFLETLLHAVPWGELAEAAERFAGRLRQTTPAEGIETTVPAVLRTLFNEVSLSPYTDLVDKTLALLGELEERGHLTSAAADFLSHLLRQLGRHLTAYDLVTFHHRGANYPDALLLDAVLKAYLDRIERQPELFLTAPEDVEHEQKSKRLRRRALRQAWLLRCGYEGHLVPDLPTSQGENARVLPPPHTRVPEEQILNPVKRTRRLYADDPLSCRLGDRGQKVLRLSVQDLQHPAELRELGTALFLDRPLGFAKAPTEPDQTLLLSYVAFSRSIAERRLRQLADRVGFASAEEYEACRDRLEYRQEVNGIPAADLNAAARPGVVSLADAQMAAGDFVLLRSTTQAVRDFVQLFFLQPPLHHLGLVDLAGKKPLLIVRSNLGLGYLAVHDDQLRRRLELEVDVSQGYASRGGIEFPAAGLRLVQAWEEVQGQLRECDLRAEPILFRPVDGI